MKSGIIQPLIDFAKAGQEKADKDAETKNINGLFYLGKASAFSDIILKAELLFKVQQNKDSQPALQKTHVIRWVEFEKQKPPLDTLVACRYEDGRVDAGEFKTDDDVDRMMQNMKPNAWFPVTLPPIV